MDKVQRKSNVVKIGRDSYYITCAACGKETICFGDQSNSRSETDDVLTTMLTRSREKQYKYLGIVISRYIDVTHKLAIITLLKHNRIPELNDYLVANCSFSEGMDAYCPECSCIYCREHYHIQTVMADDYPGFYDCTTGLCPNGHKRIIDD